MLYTTASIDAAHTRTSMYDYRYSTMCPGGSRVCVISCSREWQLRLRTCQHPPGHSWKRMCALPWTGSRQMHWQISRYAQHTRKYVLTVDVSDPQRVLSNRRIVCARKPQYMHIAGNRDQKEQPRDCRTCGWQGVRGGGVYNNHDSHRTYRLAKLSRLDCASVSQGCAKVLTFASRLFLLGFLPF